VPATAALGGIEVLEVSRPGDLVLVHDARRNAELAIGLLRIAALVGLDLRSGDVNAQGDVGDRPQPWADVFLIGEAAIREPWRSAASYLERAGRPVPFERWGVVRESLKANAPLSSGMGRLFDAVAALLGLRERVSYEGQAAIELEWLAGDTPAQPYACRTADGRIAGAELVAAAHDDLAAGRPRTNVAAAFHEGVAAAAAAACEAAADAGTVVLSGGSFQNLRLLASTRRRLQALGFRVLSHRVLPPNDGGISYGQAAVAAARLGHATK